MPLNTRGSIRSQVVRETTIRTGSFELDAKSLRQPVHVRVVAGDLACVQDVGVFQARFSHGLQVLSLHVPGLSRELEGVIDDCPLSGLE